MADDLTADFEQELTVTLTLPARAYARLMARAERYDVEPRKLIERYVVDGVAEEEGE